MKVTKRGRHYHLEGCPRIAGRNWEEATPAVIAKRGLEPCEVCHPDSAMGMTGRAVSAAGTSAGAPSAAFDEDVPFLNPAENEACRMGLSVDDVPRGVTDAAVLREIVERYGERGLERLCAIQDMPDRETALDPTDPRNESAFATYDMALAGGHESETVAQGLTSMEGGRSADEFLVRGGDLTMEDVEHLMSSDLFVQMPEPESLDDMPEPLPSWDAVVYEGPEKPWYSSIRYATDDPTLAALVAANVAPAMEKWPAETSAILQWGLDHGFMTDPASTRFHLCTPGGLACHSASVADRAVKQMERPENKAAREELGEDWREITQVVALWHDACKVGYYAPLVHRNPENGAFYTVAEDRQGDKRHGDLSEEIVRRYYGDKLPEVAYTAISLHMGQWDYRRELDRWVKSRCDEEARTEALARRHEQRSDQDERIRNGKIWPQLRTGMEAHKAIGARLQNMNDELAGHTIAMAAGGKTGSLVEGLIEQTHGDGDTAAEARRDLSEIVEGYRQAASADDAELAGIVMRARRLLEDRSDADKQQRAEEIRRKADEFAAWADRQYEEHPFVKLIHEADKWSSTMGR